MKCIAWSHWLLPDCLPEQLVLQDAHVVHVLVAIVEARLLEIEVAGVPPGVLQWALRV